MVYSATQLAKKLDISRSYLYYLKDNGVIEFDKNNSGKVIWDEDVFCKLQDYISKNNDKKNRETHLTYPHIREHKKFL